MKRLGGWFWVGGWRRESGEKGGGVWYLRHLSVKDAPLRRHACGNLAVVAVREQ